MSPFLTTHRLHLTPLSPLHIGCGEVYEPTSFVVKEKENKLVCFNGLDFLASLSEEDRSRFPLSAKKALLALFWKCTNSSTGLAKLWMAQR